MELMSQYQGEQHVAKELAARLAQQEDELKEIREHVSKHQLSIAGTLIMVESAKDPIEIMFLTRI